MENLGPVDVRVLLQAEEELSQVTFALTMFISLCLHNMALFKVNVTMFSPNIIATSLSSVNSGREFFPPQKPLFTIFSCQRLGELNVSLFLFCLLSENNQSPIMVLLLEDVPS